LCREEERGREAGEVMREWGGRESDGGTVRGREGVLLSHWKVRRRAKEAGQGREMRTKERRSEKSDVTQLDFLQTLFDRCKIV
jgi:hypothetical protein